MRLRICHVPTSPSRKNGPFVFVIKLRLPVRVLIVKIGGVNVRLIAMILAAITTSLFTAILVHYLAQ
jgi:hypothetical protein